MSGSWMFDNSVPYQFSRAPERMYAQAPLRRGQPSYGVVAPSEQGYIPVDHQGNNRVYPHEQGFVPVHSFPEDLEHFYGVRPREQQQQVYRARPRSDLRYVSSPPHEAYDSYVPVVRPGSHPMVDMVPARDGGGYGWRQAYDGPVRLPTKREWESRGPYGGIQPGGVAFRPFYGDAGFDQPEPMADLAIEEDRAPYHFVRAPSLQQGRIPIAVRDVSGVPHLVIGGAGNEDADSRHMMRKVCDPESVRNILVRDGEKDGNRPGTPAAAAPVASVRSIPVTDSAVTTAAQGGATKRKEEKGLTGDGNALQGLLKKGFLAPAATKSRSTSPTSERRDQEKSSATHSKGKEDSAAHNGDRVFTVPLAELENSNLDKVMKAIFDAMSEGKSSKTNGETQATEATAPTAEHPDGSDTKQEITKTRPTVAQEPKLSGSKSLVNVNKKETKPVTGSEGVRGEQQPSGAAKSDDVKTEEVVKPKEQAIVKVPIGEDEAARRIQALFRGYSLRRTKPLEKARVIARVRSKLRELEGLLADQEAYATLRKDPKERLRVTETVMALLLQLDSIQGVHPNVRDLRKVVAHDLTRLQDTLDAKLREISLSTSDVESEKTAELCKGEVEDQVVTAQQTTEEKVVTTQEASQAGQSEVAQGYPNDVAVVSLNNTDRAEDCEAVARVVEPPEDTACGQHKEAADGSSGVVEESAEGGCHVMVGGVLPATAADDMLDRETRVIESTFVEGAAQGGQEATLVVEVGRDGKELEDESSGKELEDESSGADRVAEVGPLVMAEEEAPVAKGIIAEAGGRQGDEAWDSSVEGAVEVKPHVMLQAERSSDRQKPSFDTSGPEEVGAVVQLEEDLQVDLAPNGDEVIMSVSDGENTVAASSAGAVVIDTKVELGLELPSTASDEAHVVEVADAWQELETKLHDVEDNKDSSGTVSQELREIFTGRDRPEAISSTTKEEYLLTPGNDEGGHVETVNAGGKLINDNIMNVASLPAPILAERDDELHFFEQEICKSATSHEQQPLHNALTPPPWQLGACATTKEKLQVPSRLAASQNSPVAEDMGEVDEPTLMRHLIEENRKWKALVQTLIGLSQAQTRSVVDRLDRLESRVCDSSKTRDHRRRRPVTRRRK